MADTTNANQSQVKPGKIRWGVLVTLATGYIAVTMNIQGFKALLPLVTDDFLISRAEAGLYSSLFFLSATLVAIFSGRVVDFLGSRRGIIIGASSVGCLILLHTIAPVFLMILLLAFFTGIGFSLITPSANKGVILHSTSDKRAVSMGITHAGGGIGGLIGATILPILGEMFSWRVAMACSGTFALLIGAYLFINYRPDITGKTEEAYPRKEDQAVDAKESSSFFEDVKLLLTEKYLLSVCIVGFLFGCTVGSVTTHLTLFLHQDVGLSLFLAGASLGVFQIGGVLGQPAWGYVNDRYLGQDRRLGLILLGLSITFFIMLVGVLLPRLDPSVSIYLLFSFLFGLGSLGIQGLYFTTIGELISEQYLGTATGLALIFIRSGSVVAPPLFGYVADLQDNYELSWILLGGTVLILTGVFFLLSRRYRPQSLI